MRHQPEVDVLFLKQKLMVKFPLSLNSTGDIKDSKFSNFATSLNDNYVQKQFYWFYNERAW